MLRSFFLLAAQIAFGYAFSQFAYSQQSNNPTNWYVDGSVWNPKPNSQQVIQAPQFPPQALKQNSQTNVQNANSNNWGAVNNQPQVIQPPQIAQQQHATPVRNRSANSISSNSWNWPSSSQIAGSMRETNAGVNMPMRETKNPSGYTRGPDGVTYFHPQVPSMPTIPAPPIGASSLCKTLKIAAGYGISAPIGTAIRVIKQTADYQEVELCPKRN
jgi:hypothetical protein